MDGTAWTEVDIENYQQIDDPALIRLYAKHNLGESGPEERAQYLMCRYLNLSENEEVQIAKTSAMHGKPAAMKLLEKIVIRDLEKQN